MRDVFFQVSSSNNAESFLKENETKQKQTSKQTKNPPAF